MSVLQVTWSIRITMQFQALMQIYYIMGTEIIYTSVQVNLNQKI